MRGMTRLNLRGQPDEGALRADTVSRAAGSSRRGRLRRPSPRGRTRRGAGRPRPRRRRSGSGSCAHRKRARPSHLARQARPVREGEGEFLRRPDPQVFGHRSRNDRIGGAGVNDEFDFLAATLVFQTVDDPANPEEAHGKDTREGARNTPFSGVANRGGIASHRPGRSARPGYSPSSRKPPNWPHAMRAPRRWNARSTPAPVFADVMRNSAPQPSATFWISSWPNSPFASRSTLFTAMRTGTRMTTLPTASIQPGTPSSVLRRVRSATARTPRDPAKYAFLSSSRKVSSPMTSQIVMSSCTSRCFSLIGMRSSFFVTFAPRVVSYRSSYWSRTYLRIRDVFPTAASPTRHTLAFMTTDRMDTARHPCSHVAPRQNSYPVIGLRKTPKLSLTCDSSGATRRFEARWAHLPDRLGAGPVDFPPVSAARCQNRGAGVRGASELGLFRVTTSPGRTDGAPGTRSRNRHL